MKLIGALKFEILGKEVTNEADWHPKIQVSVKTGHQ
jgi:hypothetical protein